MKGWILIGIALLLFAMRFREHLENEEESSTSTTTPDATTTQASSAATAAAAATTTGGSSTSSYGPNSGSSSSSRNRQVFGPVFTSLGESGAGDGGDSSRTNNYPQLLGGGVDESSTRIPGAGITSPSKNWTLTMNGSLPSGASLGTEESSRFFPMSRQPGDMDLIPDPYRLSRNFSTSSYSSKTEPVPFLTDFSAFLR